MTRPLTAMLLGLASAALLAAPPPLTGLATLQRAYDAVLDARFAEAERLLQRCDAAPREACAVVDLARRQWQILLDPRDTGRDAETLTAVSRALEATRRWTEREPLRAEPWFYQGAALGVRVQLRALRGQTLAAARDGRAIKRALERALELEPDFADAAFALGLYEYYASRAPVSVRALSWLLLLPGGDRTRGLERVERAAQRGALVASEADYQRHWLYLWYEGRVDEGLDILAHLSDRYPGNPLFVLEWADALETYRRRTEDSRDAYARVAQLENDPQHQLPAAIRARALIGLASRHDALAETDRAVEVLERLVALEHDEYWRARGWLALGRAARRLGDENRAGDAFRRVLATSEAPGLGALRTEARRDLRAATRVAEAAAYRLSLEGWRQFERGQVDEALAALQSAIARNPSDAFARARLGYVLAQRGRMDDAHAAFEHVLADPHAAPALMARVALSSALLFETAGQEAAARARFEHARDAFGASTATTREARAGLARLSARPRAAASSVITHTH